MLIARSLLVCGLGLSMGALAQSADPAFEYSPVARLLQNGQYRAEIWRRDVAADRSEVAWSDGEPMPTAATAITEACASLKQNFDPAFPCPHPTILPAPEGGAVKPSLSAVSKLPPKKAPPAVLPSKASVVKTAVRPPAAPPTSLPPPTGAGGAGGGTWARDFWKQNGGVGGSD